MSGESHANDGSYPILIVADNSPLASIKIMPKLIDKHNYILDNCLYINAKNVRTTFGGVTPVNQMDSMCTMAVNGSLFKDMGTVQYSFRSKTDLWLTFVNFNKINDYLKNIDETIKTVYLVNENKEFSYKLKPPYLVNVKSPDGTPFKLNYSFDIKNNMIVIPKLINITF